MNYDFKDLKKILVIKLRHIGDVLLTAPVFRALRENFPDAYIAALVFHPIIFTPFSRGIK